MRNHAWAAQRLRPGNEGVAGDGESQGQIRGVTDADANRDKHGAGARSIVAQLQWRLGIDQIQPVVCAARNSQSLAQAAGAGGQFLRGCSGSQATVPRHLIEAGHWLQRAYQNASAMAYALAGNIHAGVHSIDEINVSMPRRSEEHLVPWRGAAIRVRRGIGGSLVRSQVGFDFDDASGYPSGSGAASEHFAEQPTGYALWRRFKEGALQQLSLQLVLCALAHEVRSVESSNALVQWERRLQIISITTARSEESELTLSPAQAGWPREFNRVPQARAWGYRLAPLRGLRAACGMAFGIWDATRWLR